MNFIVREATRLDAEPIARVHVASIRTVGAKFYSPEIVEVWGAPRDGSRYGEAMMRGEAFFVACVSGFEVENQIVGFSSHRLENEKHRVAVYVDGTASRQGVGKALFSAAEDMARQRGALEINVTASLAAVDFYKSLGFEEVSRGEHTMGNLKMACVFMKKDLGVIRLF
jgi:GNAT superfamily N-acetyltransferase